MESVFQQAAQQKDQPATPATPASTLAAPAGSMDQMFQQAAQAAPKSAAAPAQQPPAPKPTWMERFGKMIPESVTPALMVGQKYLSEPLEAAGKFTKETGEDVGRAPAEMLTFFQNAGAYMPSPYKQGPVSVEPVESAAKRLHPTLSGVGEGVGGFAGSLASPENLVIMAAMPEAEAYPVLSKMLATGFAAQMTKGAYDQIKNLRDHWKDMDPQQRAKAITESGLQTTMAGLTIAHAATPTEPGKTPTPEPTLEPTPEARGTVKGPRTKLRPTTHTTAGVEAPVSAVQQENAPLTAKAANKFTTMGAAKEFQRAATAPAAQRQMVSTLGQVAEDSIGAHNALMDNQPTPEGIAGTQQKSRYDTIDAIAQAAKGTSEKTYQKADAISARKNSAWEAQRDKAIADHKMALDHYNELVDFHNNNLEEGNEPLERAQFNEADVKVPDKPKTYSELKSELEQAMRDGTSADSNTRTNAWKSDIPKAEKALDKWFNDHSDEISPAEYKSARRLRADAENYQTMANSLRSAMNKGTITGNTLRTLEATIDNKAIRRGQAPGQFKRLLGQDGYDNWQNVTKLLDPVKGGASLGQYALEWVGAHLLGPMGYAGKLGLELLLNKVMFDANFGSVFSSIAHSIGSTGGVPQSLRSTFMNLWRSERGEAGMPGSVPHTPEEEQIASHIQNGGSTFSAAGKDLAGTDAYAVGSYPERTERHDELTPDVLADFKDRNSDVLSQPDHMVGTWKNPETGKHELDVSRMYRDRDEAIQAGRAANQIAIGHMGTFENIPTGGTGEVTNSARDISARYNKQTGRPAVSDDKVEVDKRGEQIADAYENLKHDPNDPKVKKAYDALIKETKDQLHLLQDNGYRIEPSEQDPYNSYEEMAKDVRDNRRLKVWTGGKPPSDHPLSGVDPETGLTNNTLMRAVHDIMGHVAGDNDFTEKGEENAYQRHAQSYSDEALPALTTETKAQTSHYWHSQDVRNGGEHQFVQKAALLPEEFYARKPEGEGPQSFSDLGNGVYEVKTNVDGETNGHLTAKEVDGNPDAARVESHWVAAGQRGKGIGTAQLQHMAENLADAGKTMLLSDTEMTGAAKKAWDRLKDENPDAVTKTARGYIYDLSKIKPSEPAPATPSGTMSMEPGPAGFPEAKYSRNWPTDKQLIDKYGEANDPSQVAFLTRDGRGVAMKGTEHDRMLGGTPKDDLRTPYVNETGNIRMRSYGVYGDRQFNFSLPEGGISKDQYDQIMKWGPQLRTGRVYIEPANPTGRSQVLTNPSDEQLSSALRSMVPVEGQTQTLPDKTGSEISTRRPTAADTDPANNVSNVANLAAVDQARPSRLTAGGKQAMGLKEKLARTVANYTGIPYSDEELQNPDHVINKFVNRVSDNLEWLYNQVPESIRGRTKEWYVSANKVLGQFAQDYGVTHEQAAGVTAALSPQNPWDNNVALAKRMMDVYKNRQNFSFTPAMEQKSAELRKVPTQSKAFKGLLKDIAGKKLSQVKNENPDVQAVQRALWIRLYDEAHNSNVNDQYAPTGEVTGHSPDARSWIGLDHMGKAVKILDDGSIQNIHNVMGQGHKIRNFYNNLINPNSQNGHVTIDTHAVSAAHLSPFGPKDTEAAHNFGGSTPGIPVAGKDAATGLGGTYPLYAEAYQRTAKKLGILPRELQSITWEAIKSLMGDEKKTPELKKRVREIWTDAQDGRLTPEQARDKVKAEAGGFAKPSWMSDEEWDRISAESGDTSFEP